MNTSLRILGFLAVGIGLAAIALAIVSQASAFHVQDDAYMYARYAHNLVSGSGLAWDPGGEPTYGATALLYVPWVAVVGTLFPGEPGLTIVVASGSALVIALALVARLLSCSLVAAQPARTLTFCACAATLAFAHRKLAAHATNGMDTGFAMSCSTLLFLAWWRCLVPSAEAAEPSAASQRARRALVILASWLALAARPDLGLYSLGIPLVLIVIAPGRRRELAGIFAVSVALAALTIAWANWYFGVPAPLSVYIKSFATDLGAPFLERHGPEARAHFGRFLIDYAPLWICAALDLPSRWKARAEPANALWLAVLAPTLLHWLYYRFEVLQLIAFHQRFYYPTLPALLFLGATSMSRVLAIFFGRARGARWTTWTTAVGLVVCAVIGARALVSAVRMCDSEIANHQFARFDIGERYDIRRARDNWFALDGFTALPDDVAIATTEVGLPSAMNPKKRIIDMVGLNETGFALDGFDAHRLCAELRPDVIYMPHPDYTTMTRRMLDDPAFQADYELIFPSRTLYDDADPRVVRGVGLGLALQRASPHFAELKAIVEKRAREVGDGSVPPGGARGK